MKKKQIFLQRSEFKIFLANLVKLGHRNENFAIRFLNLQIKLNLKLFVYFNY